MEPDDLKKHAAVLNLYRDRARLQKRGKEYVAKCPLPGHKDDTPSFTVYQHEGVWIFKCHGCTASGNVIQFIQRMNNCGFKVASEIVAKFCGADAEKTFGNKGGDDGFFYTFNEYKKHEEALERNSFVQNWLLQERGINMESARKLHFGYAQDISKFGGDGKGWISLPVIEDDKIVAVEFRSIVRKDVRKAPGMKTTTLFGGHLIDPFEPVFVTEGGFDTAILTQHGFTACSIPSAGVSSTPEMIDTLRRAEYVILAGDTDVPGIEAMKKLFKALQTGVYILEWPKGSKDANEAFLSHCKRNAGVFKELVERQLGEAKLRPMPGLYNVQYSMENTEHTKLIDHPDRLRLPWKSVDEMAIILPGTVTTVFSTDSGQGKSTWVFQATIHAAKEHKQVVLNYQAELTPHQIDTIFTSHLLRKDRLTLEEEDYKKAARLLGSDFQYYIGRDTSLISIDQVLDLIESGIRRFTPDIVILDNLHFLCRGTGKDVYKEQAAAMQRITNIAASHNLKFIVVHQARKADQQHKGKTKHVSDLDGAKAIQNDSSTIFSIHREEVKHKGGENSDNEYSPVTEISVKKFRDKGPGGSFTRLMFAGNVCSFGEMAPESMGNPTPEPETVF